MVELARIRTVFLALHFLLCVLVSPVLPAFMLTHWIILRSCQKRRCGFGGRGRWLP